MNSLAASDLPSSTAGTPLLVVAIDLIVERDRAEQLEREDLDHVGLREHVAALHEVRRDAVDDEARRHVGRGEQADDAVGVADRRDLGGRDDDRLVGAGDRVLEALLDAGRAVDEHEVVRAS